MTDYRGLIHAYFDRLITDDQFGELSAWLSGDESHRELFIRESYLHQQLDEILEQHDLESTINQGVPAGDSYFNTESIDALLAMERNAGVCGIVDLTDEIKRQELEKKETALCIQRVMLGETNLIRPVKRIVIPKVVFYGAIAAVIALTTMLFWPTQSPSRQVVEEKPTAPQLVQVATLVEQTDAYWLGQQQQMVPGQAILNQSMHLTSGVARFRFNNEAVVILEAPCSIEPISGGEIKITHGKLVGRCETANSRGFVVQTPGARILDLGTEFSVDVPTTGQSTVSVAKGLVEVAPMSTDGRLGQPLQIPAGGEAVVDPIRRRVVMRQPVDIPVVSTGKDLSVGDFDLNWRIVAVSGDSSFTPRYTKVVATEDFLNNGERWALYWLKNNPSTSQWISFEQFAFPVAADTQFVYQTTVHLDPSVDLSSVRLDGKFLADDQLSEIKINGRHVAGPYSDDETFKTFQKIEVLTGWRHGRNTVEFVIYNNTPIPSSMGLRAALTCQGVKEIDSLAPTGPP